ncbi:TPA: hypothetical protein U2M28_003943 [Providencia stuartii]|uniref:hypothetical protein n=1 Tax=Providencia stuartii TaxID=588 RepID=UPI00090A8883|nr:hypothetical protein [Providencia stuartii]APG53089.1 hypothetical protein BGK56_19980 [Providencia stuartii]MBG5903767.1 hypothetical protein [Providencia stuartii]MBG5934644.1 hypothetical protein [Providencia stuartii]WAZ73669.1 hypothetical protein O4Z98_13660 [Providencia stuartii]WAZ79978.1 hypothetical protein O4001_07250 [Providencia stuartii]
MSNNPLIIDALEEVGPCDIDTLALHMDQSAQVVNAMITNQMRKGAVKLVNGMYQLTNQPEPKTNKSPIASKFSCQASDERPKIEILRGVLQQSSQAMTAAELAKATGDSANNIGGRLKTDIKNGNVISLVKNGLKVYQWVDAKEEKSPLLEDTSDNQLISLNSVTKPEFKGEKNHLTPEQHASVSNGTMNVPNSKQLRTELVKIDDELIQINSRMSELTKMRQYKSEMYELVTKLEKLMEVVNESV